jgi:hypothetical protein
MDEGSFEIIQRVLAIRQFESGRLGIVLQWQMVTGIAGLHKTLKLVMFPFVERSEPC